MTETPSLLDLQERHQKLYDEVHRDSEALLQDDELLSKLEKRVDTFLFDIQKYAELVDSFDNYQWLNDTVSYWQTLFVSLFERQKKPILLTINKELTPPQRRLTGEELRNHLEKKANLIGKFRKDSETITRAEMLYEITYPSNKEEMDRDWYAALTEFAMDVIDGKVNLADSLTPEIFPSLENVWFKDVKQMKAYFVWKRLSGRWDPYSAEDHYYTACRQIAKNLFSKTGLQADKEKFGPMRRYLLERYLVDERTCAGYQGADNIGGYKPAMHSLILRKAERIFQTTGNTDSNENWGNAETYVNMYYGSIIDAVVRSGDAIGHVLEAFRFSKAPACRFLVINAFEAALAIYFLDPEAVCEKYCGGDKDHCEPIMQLI